MSKQVWTQAIKASADPQRARHHLDLLSATGAARRLKSADAGKARVLCALFAGSQALSAALIASPDWIDELSLESLGHPRRDQGFRRDVNQFLRPALQTSDHAGALKQLRRFKHRELLRIGTRDLARLGATAEIIRELSDVADVCLSAVLEVCRAQLVEKLGEPYHLDADGRWQPTQFCVLGMGKLGGQELNYSSDVDVIFVYADEGQVFKEPPPRDSHAGRGFSNHQFFKRLTEAFVAEISRLGVDGALYRIDLRLRPEGDAGPLARSLPSCESYYFQWGQTWERMALIKARCVAGDEELATEFLEMVQSFRYPRSFNERVLREVAAMKQRIETEVLKSGEMDRNVKLGRGGIREIEFTVQTLQVMHAGQNPFLQGAQTLPTLDKLVQYKLLSADDAKALRDAYGFLRDIEHRLQMDDNQQTHTIPTQRAARERLARLMGFDTLAGFEQALKQHTTAVHTIYNQVLGADGGTEEGALPRRFAGAESEWKRILAGHGFRDPESALKMLNEFAHGPGYVHVSARTTELALGLLPRFFALCPITDPRTGERLPEQEARRETHGNEAASSSRRTEAADTVSAGPIGLHAPGAAAPPILSDPDRVLKRLDSYITAYGARSLLLETWISNPALFELLLLIFDRSEFLAERAIRTPDLVDELVLAGRLRQRKTSAEILEDLRHGQEDADQAQWLRRYHPVEFMRIGSREILGLADVEQNLVELSALADACLQYALEVVSHRNKLRTPPLVIIGLGKLGGAEITYGSDLDVVFVADDAAKNLPKLHKFAAEVMDLLTARTGEGFVFNVDARLRPDGEKGPLVNAVGAYEEYYRHRAQLWEIQSLTRMRPVAGDLALGERFQRMAGALTDFSRVRKPTRRPGTPGTPDKTEDSSALPSCVTSEWKQEIHRMRMRIEKERTPTGLDHLAIKTGSGGLVDAEFIAQTLCLEHGWHEANTVGALERARAERALGPDDAESLITNYRRLRRVEIILRRWSYEGETVLPTEPAPLYRVAVRCGFTSSDEFRNALTAYRKAIRAVYAKVFGS